MWSRVGKDKIGEKGFYHLFFWFVIGSCAVLIPLLGVMTKSSIDRQERFTEKLLIEKGEALIRSYEASARAAAARAFGPFERQKLVIELAHQPGVDYIILTDGTGLVRADSEPFRIGGYYALDIKLDSSSLSAPSARRIKNPRGADTFEVFRATSEDLFIFIGLDMGPIWEAHRQDVKHTILVALVLFMVGLTAVIALLITYRYRMARSSLVELRLFSHYLLEHLPVGVVSLNGEGRVILVNEAASRLLGIDTEKAQGLKGEELLPGAVRESLTDLATCKHVREGEVEWKGKDERISWAEVIATRLEDGGTIVLLKDISEVRTLRQEVERSRRLAAIGSLAAGIAHEIRNPLSSIKGFATYFMEKYGSDAEAKEAAQVMIMEIERLNRVITQLLNLARPPMLRYKFAEMGSIIDESIRTVAPEFSRKGVEIRNEVRGINLSCDPDQMKQVFINLFLNALAATEAGGKVMIEGKEMPDGRLSITVSDTGVGIKEEDLPHVFDPFFTTKSTGTGLGLAVVHKIMEAHGGEIVISSYPGGGTEVNLLIPKEKRAP